MRVAVTGSIAFDYIMTYPGQFREMLLVERLDKISVSFLVDEMTRHYGGVAPNIAYTMALLGERPLLVGAAGRDFNSYREWLEASGVDTSGTAVHDDLFTASFFVSTDETQNQIAMFYTGAMARAASLSLAEAVEGKPDLVVISPNHPLAMSNLVAECKLRAIPYVYDPSQQVARSDGESLAAGVDGAAVLILNEYEHAALQQKTGLAHDDLLARAQTVIVTRGADGADIYTNGLAYHIPVVPPTHIADPTGVGDAFRGGLLKGLAASLPWEIAGRIGALAATYVLEQIGTQNHRYTLPQFVARFRQHFDDDGLLDAMAAEPTQTAR